MQRKESDKCVFGLRCLQILLNRIIFIHDKNEEKSFSRKKHIFSLKRVFIIKTFLRLTKCMFLAI